MGNQLQADLPQYLDAHLHLHDSRFVDQQDRLIRDGRQNGIGVFFTNATQEDNWSSTIALSRTYPAVVPFLGIHPWYAETVNAGWENRLKELVVKHQCGLGETGLDKRCDVDFDSQVSVFTAQLRIAMEMKKPIVIHCVQCWGRLLDILQSVVDHVSRPLVMVHSYTGSIETMRQLVRLGVYLSFSSRLCDEKQLKLQRVFAATPLSNILLETDAPDQLCRHTATKYNAVQNEPAFIIELYQKAATLKNMQLEKLKTTLWNNGQIFKDAVTAG